MSDAHGPGEALSSPERSVFVRESLPMPSPGPASCPEPYPAFGARRKTRINWDLAVHLLAEGNSTAQVAQTVGCSRRHICRILRRSRKFARALAEAEAATATDANLMLAALRPNVAVGIAAAVDRGDINVLLRLADRLKLFDRPGRPARAEQFMTTAQAWRSLIESAQG